MGSRNRYGAGIRYASAVLVSAAQDLRRNATSAERVLWQALKGRQLNGLRFRRQHPVGRFILDFYCSACKLVVEVDGGVHEARKEGDASRTRELLDHGYRVLRVSNQEVLTDLRSVLERIQRSASLPRPAVAPLPRNAPSPPIMGGMNPPILGGRGAFGGRGA